MTGLRLRDNRCQLRSFTNNSAIILTASSIGLTLPVLPPILCNERNGERLGYVIHFPIA